MPVRRQPARHQPRRLWKRGAVCHDASAKAAAPDPRMAYDSEVRWVSGLVLVAGCADVLGLKAIKADGGSADTSIIGWWKLGDGSGVIAADSSGHGNAGMLTSGVTWASGHNGGGAVQIDGGKNHQVDIGDIALLEPTGSMTLAAWVNPASLTSSSLDDAIISHSNFSVGDPGWVLEVTNDCGSLAFSIEVAAPPEGGAPPQTAVLCSNTVPSVDTWHHVAGVYDAERAQLHIYIDGRLDDGGGTGAPVPMQQHEPAQLYVEIGNADPGGGRSGGSSGFDGLIQDVRMYDRALTAAEIAALVAQ